VLVVGFDGVREQVDWQRAELARLVGRSADATCGSSTRRRGRARTRRARGVQHPGAVMTLTVLPTQVAELSSRARPWPVRARCKRVGRACGSRRHARRARLRSRAEDPGAIAAVVAEWRELARAGGGHASLEWAPLAVKSQVPVWDDPGAAGRIMERIKAQLDPRNILNPGRFVAGI
jgi:glycolate oxidase FAD binding subunit